MRTPEIIYLIHGEYDGEQGMVWCDDPAPDSCCDPDEAVKYVRSDIHESALKRQGNAAKMGMDAAKKDASWREENAKRLLAESNPAAIESERAANAELTEEIGHLEDSLIKQGQMLREIVSITKGLPVDKMHSTHDAVESVELLHARIVELELEEVGAKKAFSAVSDKKSAAESRVVELEKSIRSLMTELYGKKRNEAGKVGGDYE